jgi:hypothetical protein
MLGSKVGYLSPVKLFDMLTSTETSTISTLKKKLNGPSGPTHTMIPITSSLYPILTLPIPSPQPRGKDEKNLNEQKNGPSVSKLEAAAMRRGQIPMKKEDLECLRGLL